MDTIGGWILSEKMDVVEGDKVRYDDYVFKVLEIDGYHIKSLEILKITNQESIA
jgi:CBS domain containing-hemolysin-like protein